MKATQHRPISISTLKRRSLVLKRRRPIVVVGIISAWCGCLLLFLYNNISSDYLFRQNRDVSGDISTDAETRRFTLPLLLQNQAISTDEPHFNLSQTSGDALNVSHFYEYLTYKSNNSDTATINILPQDCLGGNVPTYCSFYPILTIKETLLMRELLAAFAAAAERENVPYFIAYGTLLGAYRHDGLIPWDDDLDVMISADDEDEMSRAMRMLAPKYGSVRYANRLKLFSNAGGSSNRIGSYYGFTFPSLDVFLYDHSNVSLWDVAYGEFEVAMATVFPLTRMRFWDLNLSAPRDGLSYLQELGYDVDVCQTNSYDHRLEEDVNKTVAVNCEELKHLYPNIKIKLK